MGHLTTSKGCWGCTRAITRTPGRKKKPELPPPPECLENSRILHKRCENYLIADGMGPRPPMQLYIYVGLLCVSSVGREFMRSRLDPQNEVVYCELQVSQQLATRLEIPEQWSGGGWSPKWRVGVTRHCTLFAPSKAAHFRKYVPSLDSSFVGFAGFLSTCYRSCWSTINVASINCKRALNIS